MNLPSLGDIAQSVIAVTVAVNCYQSWRAAHMTNKIIEEVTVIKEATNGLSAKLLEVTAEAKFAEGVKHGEDYMKRIEPEKEK